MNLGFGVAAPLPWQAAAQVLLYQRHKAGFVGYLDLTLETEHDRTVYQNHPARILQDVVDRKAFEVFDSNEDGYLQLHEVCGDFFCHMKSHSHIWSLVIHVITAHCQPGWSVGIWW